jgi:hypothetical protein
MDEKPKFFNRSSGRKHTSINRTNFGGHLAKVLNEIDSGYYFRNRLNFRQYAALMA